MFTLKQNATDYEPNSILRIFNNENQFFYCNNYNISAVFSLCENMDEIKVEKILTPKSD